MRKDLHNNLTARVALNSQAVAGNTTTVGNIIDIRGYHSIEFFFSLGNWTDGSFVPVVEESDSADMLDALPVADRNLLGTEVGATVGADNTVGKVGVVVGKRYVRFSVVSTGVTAGSTGVFALAVLGTPELAPTP